MRTFPLLVLVACSGDHAAALPDTALATADAASFDCPTPADPTAPGKYKVFVNSEGVTLTKGACTDSRTNCTDLVKADQLTVPPFMMGDPQRETVISTNIAIAQQIFAPYSVDFVRTRPASGNYEMLVLGGTTTDLTNFASTGSVVDQSCAAPNRNGLALEFDYGATGVYAYLFASDLGSMLGLGSSDLAEDCMCRDVACPITSDTCSFGMATASSTANCGRTGIVDEPAFLKAFLGCR